MVIRLWVTEAPIIAEAFNVASSVEGLSCWACSPEVNICIDEKLLHCLGSVQPHKDPANLQVPNKVVKSFLPTAQGSNVKLSTISTDDTVPQLMITCRARGID